MQINSNMKKTWTAVNKIQEIATSFLMILLPCMVFYQVLLRYVFKAPLMGIEEIMIFPTIWLYMLGGANASMERNHITCGILTLYIKGDRAINIFNIVKGILALGVSCWLTYWSYWYFSYSLSVWKFTDLVGLPLFFGECAILLGLTLMTIYTAVEMGDYMIRFVKQDKEKEEEAA